MAKQELASQIIKFIAKEAQAAPEKAESLQVVCDMLADAFGVQVANAAASGSELEGALNAIAARVKPSASEQAKEDALEKDPKFIEFIRMITEKGYFKNIPEGSAQYADRMKKAKEKFLSKATEAKVQQAEKHKEEGNTFIREKKFPEAVAAYKLAIELNPNNAIYYGNISAAYLRLGEFDQVIASSKRAIEVDPKYAKAYKWLGMAYMELGQPKDAVTAFESALSIEPDNKEYKERLEEAQLLAKPKQQRGNPFGDLGGMGGMPNMGGMGGMPNMGGLDLNSIMNNPTIRQMAENMMQNPQMQQMMQNMFQSFAGSNDLDLSEIESMDEVKGSPKLQAALADIKQNGITAAAKYRNDPEIMPLLQKVGQKLMQSSPNLQNLLGAFGAPPPNGGNNNNDDDEDGAASGMYS